MQRTAFTLFLLLTSPALAEDRYPSRAVEIVVPFAAGGGTDLIARVLNERLSESLKQRFVVINRPAPRPISAPRPWRTRRPTATHCC
jgi:tripartite-type tricarboxylate transporter receptor subunit TctC